MSKITVNPKEFFDLCLIFLFDILTNKDDTIFKENTTKILKIFKDKNIKTVLMNYYLNLPANQRLKYKLIKKIFYDENVNTATINISSKKLNEDINNDINEKSFYNLKDSIIKCISIMKKNKYNNPNYVISEDVMNKIIDHVLKEKING